MFFDPPNLFFFANPSPTLQGEKRGGGVPFKLPHPRGHRGMAGAVSPSHIGWLLKAKAAKPAGLPLEDRFIPVHFKESILMTVLLSRRVVIKIWYKNGEPRTMYRIKKAAAAIFGWDRPLLTFIYPGFDCGSGQD